MGEHQIQLSVPVQINLEDTLVMKASCATFAARFDLLVEQVKSCLAAGRPKGAVTNECQQSSHQADNQNACRFVWNESIPVHMSPHSLVSPTVCPQMPETARSVLFCGQRSSAGKHCPVH